MQEGEAPARGEPAPEGAQKHVQASVVGTIESWGTTAQQPPPQISYPGPPGSSDAPQQQQQSYPAAQPAYQAPYAAPYQPPVTAYPTPPGQQGTYYQQQQPPLVVMHPAPRMVIVPSWWGINPQQAQCPVCGQQIMTNVVSEPGCGAFLAGTIIFLLGGWLGCCLIPCCVESCLDQTHSCPQCHALIGRRAACS